MAAAEELLEGRVNSLPVNVYSLVREHAVVIRQTLPADVSGMMMPAPENVSKRWVVVLNDRHPRERQNFTLAHELGHIMLHQYTTPHADSSSNDVRYRNDVSSQGVDRDEIEANQFAAELLMPARLLIPRLEKLGLVSWTEEVPPRLMEAIRDLAEECKVSTQAMLLRIGNLLAH
ncbi:MAG: ImmA/IrrE family metallo-endopeptidase [Gemmatimonadales bacterium]